MPWKKKKALKLHRGTCIDLILWDYITLLLVVTILKQIILRQNPNFLQNVYPEVCSFLLYWQIVKIFWLIHKEQSFKLPLTSLAIQAFLMRVRLWGCKGHNVTLSNTCSQSDSVCCILVHSLHLSQMNQKFSVCGQVWVRSLSLCCFVDLPPFITPKRSCVTVTVALLPVFATLISPTFSQLTIPWASLSAMDSDYCTVQGCLGTKLMLFGMVDYSCNSQVPKLLCFPQRNEKIEDAFQIWLGREYIHFWFLLSNLFNSGKQQVQSCYFSTESGVVLKNL